MPTLIVGVTTTVRLPYRLTLSARGEYQGGHYAYNVNDGEAFTRHWSRLLANESITRKTILLDGRVAGHIARFERFGKPEVSYWIGRAFWGRGVATRALSEFLGLLDERPLYARVAKDNVPSIRVLEKCGFAMAGEDRGFANARGQEVEELVFELGAA